MEFLQGPWPFIIVLIAFVLMIIGVNFYVCRQYTGTWHGLRYMLDPKYWAMAVLNHHYSVAKEKGVPVQDFILDFSKRILLPKQKGIITKMREKERKLLVMLLSQEDFLTSNFGEKPYNNARHKQICSNWNEHLKQMPYGYVVYRNRAVLVESTVLDRNEIAAILDKLKAEQ